MTQRRRKFWGWGYEDQQPQHADVVRTAAQLRGRLGFGGDTVDQPAQIEDLELIEPRLRPPARLAAIMRSNTHDRVTHAYGKSYRDIVRGFRGQIDHPPDLVALPRDETEVQAVLDWCASINAAVIPFGGGTSVVGGVEPDVGEGYRGVVSLDLGRLHRVLEVDPVSRAARIQAGANGPTLEEQLRPHGMTLRFYPQSFEHSTLGGWLATRAAGHYATGPTHIDDHVQSLRALTPTGTWESRRLPASGAGPSPDRLLLGSEGTLGVITEAWMRLQTRPVFKATADLTFDTFTAGAAAVRALAQSGLQPANCRLLDPTEATITGADTRGRALMLVGFESAHAPVEAALRQAIECCLDHGGHLRREPRITTPDTGSPEPGNQPYDGGGDAWRAAFLHAPYLRDTMVAAGILCETFETAITWNRFGRFIATVTAATTAAMQEVCGTGHVTCRLTHAYPDGAAAYFTVLAPARRGDELTQWREIKTAAAEAILTSGGTITHHHAIGRDHKPWYHQQRPDRFATALHAIKTRLDPAGILNPGVLL